MTTNELGFVIETIADKIGSSAQALQPIAAEVIRQYRLESLVGAIFLGSVSIITVIMGGWAMIAARRRRDKDGDPDPALVFLAIAMWIASGILVFSGFTDLFKYLAPLPHLLGLHR